MLQSLAKPVPPAVAPESDFESVKQAWKDIGLSVQPANRKEAEVALKKVYAAAGLDAPRKIVWCGSPFSQGLARAILLNPEFLNIFIKSFWKNAMNPAGSEFKNNIVDCFRNSMRLFDTATVKQELFDAVKLDVMVAMQARLSAAMPPHIRASATKTVWDSVWKSVWDGAGDCIWRAVDTGMRKTIETKQRIETENCVKNCLDDFAGNCVKSRVWEMPMDQAWGNIRNGSASQARVTAWEGLWTALQTTVWENVAVRIGECVKASGNNSAQASGYGQHDAYWLAFYAYFREVLGLSAETEPVAGLLELAKTAGWFIPHVNVCWISERPRELRFNDEGRLHAAEGPALVYPDGWSLYVTEGAAQSSKALQPA